MQSNEEFDWTAVAQALSQTSTLTRADLTKMSAQQAANNPNVIAYIYAQYLAAQPGKDLDIRQFRQNFIDGISVSSNSTVGIDLDTGNVCTPIADDDTRINDPIVTQVVIPESPNDPAPKMEEFERLINLCVRHMVNVVPKQHFYSMCIRNVNSKTLGKLKRFLPEHATYYVIGFSSKSLMYCVFTSETLMDKTVPESTIAPASFKFLLCDPVADFSEQVRKHHITGCMYSCSSYDTCNQFKH